MTTPRVFTRLNHLLIALLSVTTLAGVVSLSPDERLPVHWDLSGQPDRFAGRDDALILMPALAVSLLLIFWAIARFASPERLAGGLVGFVAHLAIASFKSRHRVRQARCARRPNWCPQGPCRPQGIATGAGAGP